MNSAVSWMLGYTEQELQRMAFLEITHPEARDADAHLIEAFASGEQRALRFEQRYVRADGEPMWAMVSAAQVSKISLRRALTGQLGRHWMPMVGSTVSNR